MSDLWLILLPLAIGSAVVPVQLLITILLLRAPGGRTSAAAWVAGITTVRLLQGLMFGLLLEGASGTGGGGRSPFESAVLIVLAVVFYVAAARKYLKVPDEDAPPPRWKTLFEGVSPSPAYVLGVGLLGIAAKSWVFTLAAIGAIADTDLAPAAGIAAFLAFVLLAQSLHLAIVGAAFVAPTRAEAVLTWLSTFLERYDRPILVGFSLVFGTWFLLQGLSGLGLV
jgi:hypothetical protein